MSGVIPEGIRLYMVFKKLVFGVSVGGGAYGVVLLPNTDFITLVLGVSTLL